MYCYIVIIWNQLRKNPHKLSTGLFPWTIIVDSIFKIFECILSNVLFLFSVLLLQLIVPFT